MDAGTRGAVGRASRSFDQVGSVRGEKRRRVGGWVVIHGGGIRLGWVIFGLVQSTVAAKKIILATRLESIGIMISSTFKWQEIYGKR